MPMGNGKLEQVSQQSVDGTDPDGCDQLGLNARRTVGVEEVRVGELLKPGEAKGEAQEGTRGSERPPREGQGMRRRAGEQNLAVAAARPLST